MTTTSTMTTPVQSGSANQTGNTQAAFNSTQNSNGTITISGPAITNTTTGITISTANWTTYTSYADYMGTPKCFKLGDKKINIYNRQNKCFFVTNVNFKFETTNTDVKLVISTNGTTILKSLDDVRNYIKTMKLYYLKCKEFEKQLHLSTDFA